jgi:molybdopterin guanine dinucleotide-containing S/N-oxide reductase-like protein
MSPNDKTTESRKQTEIHPDKTVIRSLGLGGLLGGSDPSCVDVKDGKILRIRPMHFDWKYERASFNPWKFERNGKKLESNFKGMPSPFSLSYKKRAYSPNRIKYPLKRVDWDPEGERNTENRGKSRYVRISWDEATDIIASEIRRIHRDYGPLAILAQGDGHGENKTIHTPHGHNARLLEMLGGFTQQVRNPDSWEGFYWGSKHVWGQGLVGMMHPSTNIVKDMTEHCEQMLFWGCDPETTPWGFVGQFASRLCFFWREVGIRHVYICPDLNYGAAIHADKWIPVLPNTDSALQLAIIYIWLKEGSYDKEYVDTHTVGMDKVEAYVMGEDDGIPKTPEWASAKCGVAPWTIKALAREFAAKVTSVIHYFGGGMFRGPYSHEPGRLECILLGMQGLGGPGVHQAQISYGGMPRAKGLKSTKFFNPTLSERLTRPVQTTIRAWGRQLIPKTMISDAILNPPIKFWGSGGIEEMVEDQFVEYQYPLPKEQGGTEIRMMWTDTPCRITCWNSGNNTIVAERSPKIEFILAQHPWLENDCLYADIILPANTTLEVDDIVTNTRQGIQHHTVNLQNKAIEPVGESRSDYEVVLEIARKLGKGEEFSQGLEVRDLQQQVFYNMELENFMSWEEFEKNQYLVLPTAEDWEDDVVGLRPFHDDPENNPLPTPTGKLEFWSERLEKNYPCDEERPSIPKWVEKSAMHDERVESYRANTYPLLLMSNHGRWRVHSQADDISWCREAVTCKVKGWDNYLYEPCWINPLDAASRGISDGDIVQVFNERGAVLCGARVWERVRPGVVYVDHGARHDPIIPGKLDRGGAINTISGEGITSKRCVGQATSGYLVDVGKVGVKQMDQWRRDYPEPFAREYDPGAGLRFDAWVEDKKQNVPGRP